MGIAREVEERRLTVVPDELQAQMVRALLAEHDIACVVRSTALGQVQWGGINPGMGGPREIIVGSDRIDEASELLRAPHDELDDDESVDVALDEQRVVLGRVFGLSAIVLFGVPIAAGLLWGAVDMLRGGASAPF